MAMVDSAWDFTVGKNLGPETGRFHILDLDE
jgi:hypothetical protein